MTTSLTCCYFTRSRGALVVRAVYWFERFTGSRGSLVSGSLVREVYWFVRFTGSLVREVHWYVKFTDTGSLVQWFVRFSGS